MFVSRPADAGYPIRYLKKQIPPEYKGSNLKGFAFNSSVVLTTGAYLNSMKELYPEFWLKPDPLMSGEIITGFFSN